MCAPDVRFSLIISDCMPEMLQQPAASAAVAQQEHQHRQQQQQQQSNSVELILLGPMYSLKTEKRRVHTTDDNCSFSKRLLYSSRTISTGRVSSSMCKCHAARISHSAFLCIADTPP